MPDAGGILSCADVVGTQAPLILFTLISAAWLVALSRLQPLRPRRLQDPPP
jgi:hypothetical protein